MNATDAMTAARPRLPYTYDDYCTLPEDMSRRYELLHGDFYMVPAPTTRHQRILKKLYSLLQREVEKHRLGDVLFAPVDVILGQGDAREVVQPDLLFIAQGRLEIVKLHGIEGPPDLVVEILSPGTEQRDRGYKLTMYARHGVPEYWIIDPDARMIDVYRAGPSDYLPATQYNVNDSIVCTPLGDLSIPLNKLFTD